MTRMHRNLTGCDTEWRVRVETHPVLPFRLASTVKLVDKLGWVGAALSMVTWKLAVPVVPAALAAVAV